jgi:hypothetical protein
MTPDELSVYEIDKFYIEMPKEDVKTPPVIRR